MSAEADIFLFILVFLDLSPEIDGQHGERGRHVLILDQNVVRNENMATSLAVLSVHLRAQIKENKDK